MQAPFSFMRRILILNLWVLAVLPSFAAAANPPNVILITLDTVRADRMGFLGSKLGLTPQLDALARQGVTFERAYSQAPITPVSHATILTGTFPQYHGIRNFGDRLPPSVPFYPKFFTPRATTRGPSSAASFSIRKTGLPLDSSAASMSTTQAFTARKPGSAARLPCSAAAR